MESIKTSIDKLFDQFAHDSLAYPRTMLTTSGNSSSRQHTASMNGLHHPHNSTASASKKRKYSDGDSHPNASNSSGLLDASDAKYAPLRNSTELSRLSGHNQTGSSSLNNSTVSAMDKFEIRRLQADLLDANLKLSQMKLECEETISDRARMEFAYRAKVENLEKQLEVRERANADCEKHMQYLRKREAASKSEALKAKSALAQQKCTADDQLAQLQRAHIDAEQKQRAQLGELDERNAALKQRCEELERQCVMRDEALQMWQERAGQYRERSRRCGEAESVLEQLQMQLDAAHRRIDELQADAAAFGEWKDLANTFKARLTRLPELERDVERLQREKASMFDTLGNKLLMEEELNDLRSRLRGADDDRAELDRLRTAHALLDAELADYRQVALDHCAEAPAGRAPTAAALRVRLEAMLRSDLQAASEKQTERQQQQLAGGDRLAHVQKELDIFRKANENLHTSLKYHKTSMHRVQKKLTLVAKERDCYKQLIDNYEKDLTMSGTLGGDSAPGGGDAQLRLKLEMIERALDDYKEMCGSLERQLQGGKTPTDGPGEPSGLAEHLERCKRDVTELRRENEQLQRRRTELEQMLEHMNLKGAYDADRCKVVHMSVNPLDEMHGAFGVEVEKLRAEIERLKRRNRKLEDDNAEMTVKVVNERMNETSSLTVDLRELGTMREQIKSLEAKNKSQKDIYKAASLEYREVVYMLFGYRVDRTNGDFYRISSMFAENEEDFLLFRFADQALDMLDTEYSKRLTDTMKMFVRGNDLSLPAFMCTLNLELFNQDTRQF